MKDLSCHDFHQRRSLSLFGRRSTVDVTGFLATADPLFIFHLFCLCFTHLFSIPQSPVYYLTLCSPHGFCEWLFILYFRSVMVYVDLLLCIFYLLSKVRLITHICCPASDSLLPVPVEERVQQHATMLQRLVTAMDRVLQTMDHLQRGGGFSAPPPAPIQQVPLSTPPSPSPSEIRLALPREYDETAAGCQGFLLQLELYLATVHPPPSGHESVSRLLPLRQSPGVGQRRMV